MGLEQQNFHVCVNDFLFELKQQQYFTVTLSVGFCCGLLHLAVVGILQE